MKKNTIIPGQTYNVDEFNNMLKTTKRNNCREKYIKINKDGFWSYDEKRHITSEEVQKVLQICGSGNNNLYYYFNNVFSPFNIKIEKTGEDMEDVKSSNIYVKMMAKTITHYKGSFQILYEYGQPPITITKEFSINTTLTARDVNSFL